ncbi:hypothetical protein AB4Y38_40760 [Paraburkholderia sp. EG285A]|uniref:hypothetical protein n=1 Tax=Paraburkholderia sp. EG285A TaxID=3237009 RepID=UPI0034D1A527
MANSFAKPCVVWLSDSERQRLAEIAERSGACTERVGARLLSRALLLYAASDVIGQQESKATVTRTGKVGRQYVTPRSRKG